MGRLPLALAVALTAVPLLLLARVEPLVYDEVWHVFIARQADWGAFRAEMAPIAHPPTFFLILKAAAATFGAQPLAYRLASIAATLGSICLVGRIVERTTGRAGLAAAAALAFGTSLAAVTVGLQVRSYAVATCWMLVACRALLELVEPGPVPRRARVAFALAASLALVTHYGTAIFLVACLPAAIVPVAVDRDHRLRLAAVGRRRWRADLLTFGIPAAVLASAYALDVGGAKPAFRALRSFLFDPRREGALEFLWRNTRALLELFVPALDYPVFRSLRTVDRPPMPEAVAAGLLIAALTAVAWLGLGRGGREGGSGAGVARRVPAILLASMTALTAVLALLGRYPYGGRLRHQSFLFPFAVIVLALAVDGLARAAGRRLRGRRAAAWMPGLAAGLLAFAALAHAAGWLGRFEMPKGDYHQIRMDEIFDRFPATGTVCVDQYNLIHLFQYRQDWRWRYQGVAPGPVHVWRVSKDGQGEILVCRPGRRWQLDLSAESTYRGLAECLDATGDRRAMVLREQWIGGRARWPVERTAELARAAAAPAGLVPERVDVRGENVYLSLLRRGASGDTTQP